MTLGLPQAVSPWMTREIHDTIAAIARQPAYEQSLRQSLLSRFFRFLGDKISDLLLLLRGSPNSRLLVIAGLAIIVLVIVARTVIAARADDAARRFPSARGRQTAGQDLWTLARELANGGQYDAACHALYGAVVDALTRERLVKFHPSKTSGDYVRELARKGTPSGDFQAFARRFERVVFGTTPPTGDDFQALLALASRAVTTRAAA